MINVKEFLFDNLHEFNDYGICTLVTYNDKTEPIYFAKHYDMNNRVWFRESSIDLLKYKIDRPIDEFCDLHVTEYYWCNEEEKQEIIDKYIKPMIIGEYLYQTEAHQQPPFLPKEVDDIKIVSERECVEWIIENKED